MSACVRANERDQERERECSLGLRGFLFCFFFFVSRARARGRAAVNPRFIANSNQSKTFRVSFHKGIAFTANFDSKLASKMGFPSPDDAFLNLVTSTDIKSIRFWDPHFR